MFIRYTSNSKIGAKVIDGFPLLLNGDKSVHWISLEYCLELRRQGTAVRSIATYAAQLLDFLMQLEIDELSYSQISDSWLEAYKDSILDRGGINPTKNSDNYASQLLRTAVAFLWWLEQNEYIRGVIGVHRTNPVRVSETRKGVRHYLTRGASRKRSNVATPRKKWIEAIKTHGPQRPDLAERFELMIDWGAGLGLRAMEICSLEISDLPSAQLADTALRDKCNLGITIRSKGALQKKVPVSPLLIKKSWQYINSSRNVVVRHQSKLAQKEYGKYQDSKFVFLSDKTGTQINPGSFSNTVRSAYRKSVDAGDLPEGCRVWAHGLRHHFAVTVTREYDKRGVKNVENISRQLTRHGSEDAMEPYLIDRFDDSFDE